MFDPHVGPDSLAHTSHSDLPHGDPLLFPVGFPSDGPLYDPHEGEWQPSACSGCACQHQCEKLHARENERQEGQMVSEALGHVQQDFQSHPGHCGQHEGEAKPKQSHDFSVNW